jgi:hypothetical protein
VKYDKRVAWFLSEDLKILKRSKEKVMWGDTTKYNKVLVEAGWSPPPRVILTGK